jgi:S-sulfo-L-cysteine synthase (O-acetyl-L-serine-dependent)
VLRLGIFTPKQCPFFIGRFILVHNWRIKMDIVAIPELQVSTTHITNIEKVVGNTPLFPLKKITARNYPHVQILAKAEWFNPGGSVKDRPALNIIRTAINQSWLSDGRHLLDSTSGNMGIAYATLGVNMGIPVTIAIPESVSPERISILRALGAELIMTNASEGIDGAVRVAQELSETYPEKYFYANQYDNPANWQAHFETTAPEIFKQTAGKITHFVAGLGTSGTLTGTARYLDQVRPEVQIVAVQPDSPNHKVEGLKHLATAKVPAIFDSTIIDHTIEISTQEAHRMVRRLAREEGLFVGISSGAAAAASLKLANQIESGIVVTVFPDAGYKYLSDQSLWMDD